MPLVDPHHSQTPYTSTPDVHLTAAQPLDKEQLPPGCTPGPVLHLISAGKKNGKGKEKVKVVAPLPDEPPPEGSTPCPIIWVDFPYQSKENPFYFSRRRKWMTLAVALYFAHVTALQTSAYSIGFGTMQRDLGMTDLQAATGVSLYGWGFAVGPLCLAPISEEFGRYWTYVPAVLVYGLCHLFLGLGQNVGTILVGRWFQGLSGCIGATVVAGTVSDLYPPAKRGLPMSIFTFWVTLGPGLAPVIFSWVEADPRLEWRWIQWFQMITFGLYFPIVVLVLRETRATVLLRRKAKKLRDERGMTDGGRYCARSEVNKLDLGEAMKRSLSRPLMFLALEPVVLFFAIWAALAWGVFFIQVAALPTVMRIVHGFTVTQSGLTYISLCVGTMLGFLFNFYQDKIYKKQVGKHGVEARLYGAMAAGPGLAVGCIIFGLTAIPSVHWIGPCVGLVIILMSAYTIYQAAFVYLSECYGSHASSAVAAMSFLRIILGSSFPMFTNQMFDKLTPRWSLFMMGCIALVLAPVPYIAYYKGPWIRERSPYSKILMAEEKKRVELEAGLKEMEQKDVEKQRQRDDEAELGQQGIAEQEQHQRERERAGAGAGVAERMSTRRQESWTSNSSSTLHDSRA